MNKYTAALKELSEIGFQEFVKDAGNKALLKQHGELLLEIANNVFIDKHTDNG